MDFKVLYTEPALADLEAIMRWSWKNHSGASQRFADSLLEHIDLLESFPNAGNPVKGHPAVRRLLHSPLQVYYRVLEEHRIVEILHIWHAARLEPEL